ncbi:glycosyltransferase family 2 protein, partial [Streptococcus gallolyticus]|uniref:glycosyltransferase family 2 protein n=4 Tax=Lactobacillales TaxID=186826 RepID=UPI002284EC5B
MDALVSIVVTCYNHESYVKDCLESIFQQTYKNIELLVFNDGSLDDSDTVIKDTLSL